ncbi:MAG: hypothetical protein NWE89_07085 [Candidatus Bathyarchaeota archaeon]|nr:hypothetical protein [Candidatus Bathyarchaeota archaeon]
MKKQYLLTILILLGIGIVTTMAFTLQSGTGDAYAPAVYTVSSASGPTLSALTVKPEPFTSGQDKIKIQFTASTATNVQVEITLTDSDGTDVGTLSVDDANCVGVDLTDDVVSEGSGSDTVTFDITATGVTLVLQAGAYDSGLYEDVDSMTVTIYSTS